MSGLTLDLYMNCRDTLLVCSEFDKQGSLQALFVNADLAPYKDKIPDADNKDDRVALTIDYLLRKRSVDGRWVFVQFLTVLRDKHHTEDALHGDLNNLVIGVEGELNQLSVIKIPFVVVAMTQEEADALDKETVFDDQEVAPAEKARFQTFKQALQEYGITDLPKFYADKRGGWRPYPCPHNSIEEIIIEIFDVVNKSEKVGTNLPLLEPEFFSEDFFRKDAGPPTSLWTQLGRSGCVLVVDAVSVFHPLLRKTLSDSEVSSNEFVAMLMLSPVSTNEIQVNQLIETIVGLKMKRAFSRFNEQWDRLCEIGIGDLRSLQRWLFSVLPEEAAIVREQRRSLNRKIVREAMGEPTGMLSVINNRGLRR
jgi:hypothetical protein